MNQNQFDLVKIILDKGVLALVLGIFLMYVNRSLELYKSSLSRESELLKQNESLRIDLYKQSLTYGIQRIEKQLSEFYWPIYSALQKDNIIWKRLMGVSPNDNNFPEDISRNIESKIILENHKKVVKIFEEKMYLSDADEKMSEIVNKYISHVALYVALRENNQFDKNPIDFGEKYPDDLYSMIENRIKNLYKVQNDLLQKMDESR